ncbi:ATP-dependent DNA helicase [Trichonephila clavipes]|nr:ATP-dependent DNA helicase [Trichonephila clavipes]
MGTPTARNVAPAGSEYAETVRSNHCKAKNLDVDAINFKIQQSLSGNEITFKLIDTVVDPDEVVNYPVEFLNSLDLPGMPPHNLRLKIAFEI